MMKFSKAQQKLYSAAMFSTPLFLRAFLSMVPAEHQVDLGRTLDSGQNNLGIFIARDHGKSTISSLAYPLRRLCFDPNLRILIVQKTSDAAVKSLDIIKKHFEQNELMKAWYANHWSKAVGHTDISNKQGHSKNKDGFWQQKRIYLKRELLSKDPSIETVGIGGAITGGRADIIIIDDILDDENTKTESRLREIKRWFEGTISQLGEPWTQKIIIGTVKTNAEIDIYNMIQGNPSYKVFFMPAILEPTFDEIEYERVLDNEGIVKGVDVKNKEEIKTLWPEKWSIEDLLLEYESSLDQAIWKREKLLDLSAMSGTIFNRSYFRQCDSDEIKKVLDNDETIVYAALDSAWDTEKTSDYSSIVIGALLNQKLYIVDAFQDKLKLYDLMDLLVNKYMEFGFAELMIEEAASGKALIQMLNKETQVLTTGTSHGGKGKIERARTVSPFVNQGRVIIPEDADWKNTFLNVVTGFPFVEHDDMVDAFVYLMIKMFIEISPRGGIHV